jgi:hypothetical protein
MRPVGNETGRASVSPPREADGGFCVFLIQALPNAYELTDQLHATGLTHHTGRGI